MQVIKNQVELVEIMENWVYLVQVLTEGSVGHFRLFYEFAATVGLKLASNVTEDNNAEPTT